MKFKDLTTDLARRLAEFFAKEFDGDIHGVYDPDDGITVWGHCRKVHPDLLDTYPNGWEFMQRYDIDEALVKLNLTLDLKEIA